MSFITLKHIVDALRTVGDAPELTVILSKGNQRRILVGVRLFSSLLGDDRAYCDGYLQDAEAEWLQSTVRSQLANITPCGATCTRPAHTGARNCSGVCVERAGEVRFKEFEPGYLQRVHLMLIKHLTRTPRETRLGDLHRGVKRRKRELLSR